MSNDVRAINEMVQRESAFIDPILHEVHKVVVGQDVMIDRILIGLLTGGHILLEPTTPQQIEADGELIGIASRVEVTVVPGALQLVV